MSGDAKPAEEGRLGVAIIGCGRVGVKRAQALAPGDELLACHDLDAGAAASLAEQYGARACNTIAELLDTRPRVVVVATAHDCLAELSELALRAGAHVLVEKPAGISSAQVDSLIECRHACGRLVKVGFNHRFHPALARLAQEVHSGRHGELMYLRGRYGHGGRPGYEREWRADPARSGGGELVDQGMHLLDLSHWLAGPLPLHSALLRTNFWHTSVEDNAALILGGSGSGSELGSSGGSRSGGDPWAMLHVSWTEWKNLFSLEVFCRTAKIQVDGLGGSYGPPRLRIFKMRPELGPPDIEEISYSDQDVSWEAEWEHFAAAVRAANGRRLSGDLHDARYAWSQVEAAYAMAAGPFGNPPAARLSSSSPAAGPSGNPPAARPSGSSPAVRR